MAGYTKMESVLQSEENLRNSKHGPGKTDRSRTRREHRGGAEHEGFGAGAGHIRPTGLAEFFERVSGSAEPRLAPDNQHLRIQMAGPEPDRDHRSLVGLHGMTCA